MLSMMIARKHFAVLWMGATVAISTLLPLHADEALPYTAVVASTGSFAHAGPSEDFYATDALEQGVEVEVYRHHQDGWCAIRPLASSFSWVAAEHLEITDNPVLARVINVPVKTRVGSNVTNAHDVEYISLRKGEVVELVGSQIMNEGSDAAPSRWFKIAPPSGEFRWVHSKHLRKRMQAEDKDTALPIADLEPSEIKTYDLQPATKSPPATLASATLADSQPIANASQVQSSQHTDDAHTTGFSESSGPIQQVGYQVPASAKSSDADAEVESESSATNTPKTLIDSNTHVNAVTWEAIGSPTDPLTAPEPRDFVDRYNALNVMLSRAILGDIESWKLEKLKSQTEMLEKLAESIDEQVLAKGLADKVLEFQSLQDRSHELASSSAVKTVSASVPITQPLPLPEFRSDAKLPQLETAATGSSAIEMPQRVGRRSEEQVVKASDLQKIESVDNSLFDASGTLVVVKSKRSGLPKYAITNDTGEVVKFLSTKDGSSLAKFVNKNVGVLGQLGFIRSLNKPHVVAERVVLLQR